MLLALLDVKGYVAVFSPTQKAEAAMSINRYKHTLGVVFEAFSDF
jgi:hypothetical protein